MTVTKYCVIVESVTGGKRVTAISIFTVLWNEALSSKYYVNKICPSFSYQDVESTNTLVWDVEMKCYLNLTLVKFRKYFEHSRLNIGVT